MSFLLVLIYRIISTFAYPAVTNNAKSYPFPVVFWSQVLKASISATTIRIGASELHTTNIGRNVGGAFEGDVYNVATLIGATIVFVKCLSISEIFLQKTQRYETLMVSISNDQLGFLLALYVNSVSVLLLMWSWVVVLNLLCIISLKNTNYACNPLGRNIFEFWSV